MCFTKPWYINDETIEIVLPFTDKNPNSPEIVQLWIKEETREILTWKDWDLELLSTWKKWWKKTFWWNFTYANPDIFPTEEEAEDQYLARVNYAKKRRKEIARQERLIFWYKYDYSFLDSIKDYLIKSWLIDEDNLIELKLSEIYQEKILNYIWIQAIKLGKKDLFDAIISWRYKDKWDKL